MSETTEVYGWTEQAPHTSHYIAASLLGLLEQSGAQTVLDAGCGNGTLAGMLAEAGYDVTGLDGDAGGIRVAREKFPKVRFEVGFFEESPPGIFDAVFSTEVVEHLYSPHDLARYCYDALKPGGILLISTPYHGYLKNLALSLMGKWDFHHTALWHGGHIKFWSRKTLIRLLEDAGFEVTGFTGVGRAPWLWKSMILLARRPVA